MNDSATPARTLPDDLRVEVERRVLVARYASLEAGRLTRDYYERGVSAELKADETPVTIADRQAEELIRARLGARFPGDGYLGEEYGDQPGTSGFRWIIDPIDGTKNFIRHIPLWGSLVGLEHEGEMVGGAVYMPCFQHMYHAVTGGGAYRNDQLIRVSTVATLEEAQVGYSSLDRFDTIDRFDAFVTLCRQAGRMRGFGDVWGFLLVADGSADLMLDPTVSSWDVAALKPIIEEAGGVFTDFRNQPTVHGGSAFVGNPECHRLAMELFGPIA